MVLRHGNDDGYASGCNDMFGVTHPIRRWNKELVSRIDRSQSDVEKNFLGSDSCDDLVGCIGDLVVGCEFFDESLAKGKTASWCAITGFALLQGSNGGINHDLRGREVRLTRPEADHRLLETGLPPSIISLVARARAVFEGHEPGPARLRLRSRNGQWLVAHASCMGSSSDGPVTVVIEPAKSTDVAPIIVEAYALSPRERDVVRAIARGLSSAEIATELFVSEGTIKTHVNHIFDKLGVQDRTQAVLLALKRGLARLE